ncbi:MAG: class I SAM-dependent methyltransferase [Planctomycetes bacterium]|nr:class I SAM-dependent methyltransferase [Planctomycetota bacterium]
MQDDPFMPREYYSRRAQEFLAAESAASAGIGQVCSDLAGYDDESEESWSRTLEALKGKAALDLGSGTGRWTERLLEVCPSAIGVENAPEMLAAAHRRNQSNLHFLEGDLRNPAALVLPQEFKPEAAMARYIFSHLPRAEISAWLEALAKLLGPNAPLVLVDNRIEERNRLVAAIEGSDDTYCERRLDDGSIWKIRKNYFEAEAVAAYLTPHCRRVEAWQGKWIYCVIGWFA